VTNPSLAKEHIRGTEGLPPGVSGYVAAEETFCSRNPDFTGTLEPGGAHYDWAIFHNVPPGGEVSLEWGYEPYGVSAWVDPWYYLNSPDIPPPAECPPELVTLGTCVEAVSPEDLVKRFVDLVRNVVRGAKVACDILLCQEEVKFPIGILNLVSGYIGLIEASQLSAELDTARAAQDLAIKQYGPKSPEACQAAQKVDRAQHRLHVKLIDIFPLSSIFFPLPAGGDVTPGCRFNG
jgi:hypothetical protein